MTFNCDIFVGIATIIMGIGLIVVGWKQLGELRKQLTTQFKASQEQMRIIIDRSYASLLPSIDERYESKEMQQARNIEQELVDRAKKDCCELTGNTYEQGLRTTFLKYVTDMRNNKDQNYLVLMSKVNFFETLGYLCKRKYLSYEDVIELYGFPILRLYILLLPHIQDRQRKEGNSIYENFISLGEKAQKDSPDFTISQTTTF